MGEGVLREGSPGGSVFKIHGAWASLVVSEAHIDIFRLGERNEGGKEGKKHQGSFLKYRSVCEMTACETKLDKFVVRIGLFFSFLFIQKGDSIEACSHAPPLPLSENTLRLIITSSPVIGGTLGWAIKTSLPTHNTQRTPKSPLFLFFFLLFF